MFKVVEKQNRLAVHCIAHTLERAEHWIKFNAPLYAVKGYFMDKSLTGDSFMVIEG